jgi:hypothetical protein
LYRIKFKGLNLVFDYFYVEGEVMVVAAIVDRIEEDSVILMSYEVGIEIKIPVKDIKDKISKGKKINLTIDTNGKIIAEV